nr:protein transport protein sec31-like [Aegilops tauschii subsp. strangulata]
MGEIGPEATGTPAASPSSTFSRPPLLTSAFAPFAHAPSSAAPCRPHRGLLLLRHRRACFHQQPLPLSVIVAPSTTAREHTSPLQPRLHRRFSLVAALPSPRTPRPVPACPLLCCHRYRICSLLPAAATAPPRAPSPSPAHCCYPERCCCLLPPHSLAESPAPPASCCSCIACARGLLAASLAQAMSFVPYTCTPQQWSKASSRTGRPLISLGANHPLD